MKNMDNIKAFAKLLIETTGIIVINYETTGGKVGFFMSPRIVDYT